ncbi:hypothetical protein [Pseudooceanicola sp. 200-1SW]|uniref:hypothetical protein n=1 Tax=Pseudooceanicola sp. 200-1SW TaxID=3425949 RepID=UPI003D7F2DA4
MPFIENPRIAPGDIVSFKFPYKEGPSPYARPALVLDATRDEFLLAYCTTSSGRANAGYELRVNDEFEACGLEHASRFVLARRIRVSQSDPRLDKNAAGTPVLGHLTENLLDRQQDLVARIAASWTCQERRRAAERRGLHPRRGSRRKKAGHPFEI